eukprot:1689011-Rhodomonas_salina.1
MCGTALAYARCVRRALCGTAPAYASATPAYASATPAHASATPAYCVSYPMQCAVLRPAGAGSARGQQSAASHHQASRVRLDVGAVWRGCL